MWTTVLAAALVALASTVPATAQPLTPETAAQFATRLVEGRVWLVHAVVVRVIDGDTVVLDLDLGWHTWRKNESVRLAILEDVLAVPSLTGRLQANG